MRKIFEVEKYFNKMQFYKSSVKSFIYLLGQPLCLICQNKIDLNSSSLIEGLCDNCINSIKTSFENYERCPICSAVLTKKDCDKFHHKNIENVFSLLSLNNQLYQLYLKAKYRKNKNLMNLFSNIFDYLFPQNIVEKYINTIDFITYVPISFYKKIVRSYNPAKILAKILAKKIDKPIIPIFIEKGFQYFHIQRKENQNSFTQRFIFMKKFLSIRRIDITNKNILLIDDIYTSGKTASYLADLLLLNDASKIYLCTLFNHR